MDALVRPIVGLYGLSNGILATGIGDLSDEDAHTRSRDGAGPSVAWTIGHLCHFKMVVLAADEYRKDFASVPGVLKQYVEQGGRLVWHAPFWNEWGPDQATLLGARPADFRLQRKCQVSAFGSTWPFEPWHTPEECRLELNPAGKMPSIAKVSNAGLKELLKGLGL